MIRPAFEPGLLLTPALVFLTTPLLPAAYHARYTEASFCLFHDDLASVALTVHRFTDGGTELNSNGVNSSNRRMTC